MSAYVQLLGSAQLKTETQQDYFLSDKRYHLLAYLAYYRDWINRERLAYLFWPDTTTQNAKKNLRQLLQRIRGLGDLPHYEVEPQRLRWAVDTDVAVFQEAVEKHDWQQGLALYQGALLSGIEGDEETEFATWLSLERENLQVDWREALSARAQELEATGQTSEALHLLETLLQQDELDEEALEAYMMAAWRSGHQVQALKAYRDFEVRLREDLDLEPTAELEQLAESIRNQDDSVMTALPEPARPVGDIVIPEPSLTLSTSTIKTGFIGREQELAEIDKLLQNPDCRLLTLTGLGGVGKTRLAMEAALNHAETGRFTDGIFFVSLDALSSAELILPSIATSLGVDLKAQSNVFEGVTRFIGQKTMLVVLDNYEHLIDGAEQASQLVRACPHLKLLMTSRERLNLEGEWVIPVEGLTYPERDTVSLEEALACDAVMLFVRCARRVLQSFKLEENLSDVVKVCQLLHGSPFALELAAVWVRMLSVADIVSEIEASLDFLTASTRDISERHRSARAVFEHSWKLLNEREQDLLKKLAVFRGGFSREAAKQVAGASLPVLASLVDKSLLRSSAQGRYDRQALLYRYSREKLEENPELLRDISRKHGDYFLAFVEAAEQQRKQSDSLPWLNRLSEEQENIRTALSWATDQGETMLALRFTATLLPFWFNRGNYPEGRRWLQGVLAMDVSEPSEVQARALRGAGILAFQQADDDEAKGFFETSLKLSRELEAERLVAATLNNLAILAHKQGNYHEAEAFYEESLALKEQLGDVRSLAATLCNLAISLSEQGKLDKAKETFEKSLALAKQLADNWTMALCLNNLGWIASDAGDEARSRQLYKENLALYKQLEGHGGSSLLAKDIEQAVHYQVDGESSRSFQKQNLAITRMLGGRGENASLLHMLGRMALNKNELDSARSFYKESLGIFSELGNKHGTAEVLESCAALASIEAEAERALILAGAAAALRDTIGLAPSPEEHLLLSEQLNKVRQSFGEDASALAFIKGQKMVLEDAVAYALQI